MSYFARNKLFCSVSLDHSYNKPNRFNDSVDVTKSNCNDLSWLKPKKHEEFPLLKTEKILTKFVLSQKSLIWTFIHNNLKTGFHLFSIGNWWSSRILTPKINQHSSPVFLDTGTCGCELLTAWSTHHCCQLYSGRVPMWRHATGRKRRDSRLHPCKTTSPSAPPAEHGRLTLEHLEGSCLYCINQLPLSKTTLPPAKSTACTNESWAEGPRFEEENDSLEKHRGSRGAGRDWRSPLWPSTGQEGKRVVRRGRPRDLV